ncbi:MAG: SUMF1/EgtB/PvdO family nonheme iron enzyme [Pseudomonadota bacterium]
MSTIQATGVSVRHAISRALATANQAPREATYKVMGAKAMTDGRGRVVRAEVSLAIRSPAALEALPPLERVGWVNPDGAHPLMALVPADATPRGTPRLVHLDVYPVTWDAWLRVVPDHLPDRVDSLCPVTGVSWEQARDFAAATGRYLPENTLLSAVWGPDRYPWGHRPDPARGFVGRPRFDHIPAVGTHPPGEYGLFDLGAWLWHWVADGRLVGGCDETDPGFGLPPTELRGPVGFRCAAPFEG